MTFRGEGERKPILQRTREFLGFRMSQNYSANSKQDLTTSTDFDITETKQARKYGRCEERSKLEWALAVLCLLCLIVILALAVTISVKMEETNDQKENKDTCLTADCTTIASRVIEAMDMTVDPCNNFYDYACGEWTKTRVIPDDQSKLAVFGELTTSVEKTMKYLLEHENPDDIDAVKKAKTFYRSCVNEEQLEALNISVALNLLSDMGGWPVLGDAPGGRWDESSFDLVRSFVSARKYINTRHVFDGSAPIMKIHVDQDIKIPTKNVIVIDQPGLGLPSRDHYLRGRDNAMLVAYEQFAIGLAVEFGADRQAAKSDMRDMVDFEIELANISQPTEKRRNFEKMYKKLNVAELKNKVPEIGWDRLLQMLFKPANISVYVSEPLVVLSEEYYSRLSTMLNKWPHRTIANYIVWHLISRLTKSMPARIRNIEQEYNKVLRGESIPKPRWRICARLSSELYGMVTGRMFSTETFDNTAKNIALEMIQNIRMTFKDILDEQDWMAENTKRVAKHKADAIVELIGYPDVIMNDTYLDTMYSEFNVNNNTLLENVLNAANQIVISDLADLRKPFDKTKWKASPALVQAFYDTRNTMIFTAGIFQPPFYNKAHPKSLNYGGIGVVIGHEITHGFDDVGRQYDKTGKLQQWWDNSSIANFHQKKKCMVEQYGNFSLPEINMTVHGTRTLGENIADNGGLKASYRAFTKQKETTSDKALPGINLTHDQLFFVNYAQIWCGKYRHQYLINTILGDPHSPAKSRVIIPLQNSMDFAKAFNCPKGSYMNPGLKCAVW